MVLGLHAPEPAIRTKLMPSFSLLPIKRPPQSLNSILPCAFKGGVDETPKKLKEVVEIPVKKVAGELLEATHQVQVGGGVSPQPAMRLAVVDPAGRM